MKALKREVHEETGLRVQIGSLLGALDRRDKDAITLLFAAIPNHSSVRAKQKQKEIKDAGFQKSLPEKASPSQDEILHALRSRQLEPHRPVLGFPENPEPKEWTALPLQIDPLNQLIGGKVLIGLLIRK